MSAVSQITELLDSSYYDYVGSIVSLGTIQFQFEYVFVGDKKSSDLVVVVDYSKIDPTELTSSLTGLARALDFHKSLRPVTCIIIAEELEQDIIMKLMQSCRILRVGPDDVEEQIRDRIRTLLPLEFISPNEFTSDHKTELLQSLSSPVNDATFETIYQTAGISEAAVSKLMKASISKNVSISDHKRIEKESLW